MTKLPAIRDRSVVRSSVTPSAKYCCSGSLLRLLKGSTTIDRRRAADGADDCSSAGAVAVVDGDFGEDHSHHIPPATISTPATVTGNATIDIRAATRARG